jgi:GNAT superfamily N-acetyltransferase
MVIRKATVEDIELLISCRIDYLTEDMLYYKKRSPTQEEVTTLVSRLREYFPNHIAENRFIGMLAEIDGKVVGTAYLAINRGPASLGSSGVSGTFLNVLTYPEYRKQGIATKLVNEVVVEAKKLGVSSIELWSSAEGKVLYERTGFEEPPYTLMVKRL